MQLRSADRPLSTHRILRWPGLPDAGRPRVSPCSYERMYFRPARRQPYTTRPIVLAFGRSNLLVHRCMRRGVKPGGRHQAAPRRWRMAPICMHGQLRQKRHLPATRDPCLHGRTMRRCDPCGMIMMASGRAAEIDRVVKCSRGWGAPPYRREKRRTVYSYSLRTEYSLRSKHKDSLISVTHV